MEEIKFRWVGLNRKFNEITINNDLTVQKIIDGNVWSFFNNSNRGELGNCKFLAEELFTGLKDKNNKEAYNGDIYMNELGSKYIIFFRNGSFVGGKTKEYSEPIGWDSEDDLMKIDNFFSKCEIIGNIHQDQNLLEK